MRKAAPTVKKDYKDNFSGYVQALIERDQEGLPPPSVYNEAILADLARIYGGYFAPKLARQLADQGVDQPKTLHTLLRWLSECLAAGYSVDELVVAPRSCTTFAPIGDEMRIPMRVGHAGGAHRASEYPTASEEHELRAAEETVSPRGTDTTDQAEAEEHRRAADELRKALTPQTPPPPTQSAPGSAGGAKDESE